jgi:hypothetical protein
MTECYDIEHLVVDGEPATQEQEWLFDAAPKLLAACRSALDFLMDGTPESEVSLVEHRLQRLLADAIAEADGNRPCVKCGRLDLPLHTNCLCTECHAP